jgi:AraC-like DNA-binding protein
MSDLDRPAISFPLGCTMAAAVGHQATERSSAPHRHAQGQLLGSLKGLLSIGTEEGVWIVPAIHAAWLPPHHRHSARSHGAFDGWVVYIAEDACGALPKRPCTIRTSGLLREAVLRAATWPQGPADEQSERVAAVILDEIGSLPIEPFGLSLPHDARLLRVAQALIDDPADVRDLEAWADWAAVSSRTLSRRFVSETGFSFTAWRQRARLLRSLEMLAAGQSVSTIALDLGYATASAFIGLFRRVFNETPVAYRQRLSLVEAAQRLAP